MSNKQFSSLFIVGSGQIGSKFFSALFSKFFPGILALHEPAPNLLQLGINKYRQGLTTQQVIDAVAQQRQWVAGLMRQEGKSIYLESNGMLWLTVPELTKVFPNNRVLYIVRNPIDFVVSAGNRVMPDGTYFYAPPNRDFYLTPADLRDTEIQELWPGFSRHDKIAWYWLKCNEYLFEEYTTGTEMMMVRFEDLFYAATKTEMLKAVVAFFGLDYQLNDAEVQAFFNTRVNETTKQSGQAEPPVINP
ncbi:MAG TPA: hypothetical protein VG603_05425, partial [Chitinophagales bacterium]|nr:hypothetical protein [Chitinophagales bacterium]